MTWISPEEKEDYLDATDDGETSEKTHGASNETQLGLRLDLLVSLDVVKGRRVKVDLNQMQTGRWQFKSVLGRFADKSPRGQFAVFWKIGNCPFLR